jgi:hypothetical protein
VWTRPDKKNLENDPMDDILDGVARGELPPHEAASQLRTLLGVVGGRSVTHARVDLARSQRTGLPEVIYGAGKPAHRIADILRSLHRAGQDGMATRIDADKAAAVREAVPGVRWYPEAGVLFWPADGAQPTERATHGRVAVVAAGTSDLPVAEEAALTLEILGNRTERVVDVGVAGLHRLLERLPDLRAARCLVVVAGMEGALPSVVAGLVATPVIAVPTSVGYGAHLGGLTPLMGMLTSCATGVGVVNIDNGFGAGVLASRINRMGSEAS